MVPNYALYFWVP